jgi:hypothetical protein
MSEDEALQLALAVSQSEADARNAAQSTSTAKATNPQELNDAIAVLDAGQLEESAALFAATMQQVDRGSLIYSNRLLNRVSNILPQDRLF